MSNDLLKPNEAADEFKVSKNTLKRWEQDGLIKPIRTPGGHRRYSRQQLQAAHQGGLEKVNMPAKARFGEIGATGVRQWGGQRSRRAIARTSRPKRANTLPADAA